MRCPSALILMLLTGAVVSCARGGKGSSARRTSGSLVLTDVVLPDPSNQHVGAPGSPPTNVSLVQQMVLRFDATVDPSSIHDKSLPVLDSTGRLVAGTYQVSDRQVVFTPELPLTPDAFQSLEHGGLRPGEVYSLTVGPGTSHAIAGLVAIHPDLQSRLPHPSIPGAILISFTTTSEELLYLGGLSPREVQPTSITPVDGIASFAPHLFSDPDGWFGANEIIEIRFDAPLHPGESNVSDKTFRLLDMDHPSGTPVELGVLVSLTENLPSGARIAIEPSGVLPFGHLLAVEGPDRLRHLSAATEPPSIDIVLAVYQTPPSPAATIRDLARADLGSEEDLDRFESSRRRGFAPAEWNRGGTGVLQAARAFLGTGEIGRFQPVASQGGSTVVTLDTSLQPLPLLNGSTPDAEANTVVRGGVFHFTDIDIPAGVTLRPVGPNPLVLLATGSVRIAGTIDLEGGNGSSDHSFDSAVAPGPGGRAGAGGGGGGAANPVVYFPPGQFGLMNLITPTRGETGFSPLVNAQPGEPPPQGGQGGASTILDDPAVDNPEISCNEGNPGLNGGGSGGGGSGGSMYREGSKGRPGLGNMLPQPDRTWIDLWPLTNPPRAEPGTFLFDDGLNRNNFIGPEGEILRLQGGQGGGGGGNKAEGYYCGTQFPWGRNEFGGAFPDRVGDARGGGGGGGGGALEIFAREHLILEGGARVLCRGGVGGGGEITGNSRWGGPGGGGSGGVQLYRSSTSIEVRAGALLDVRGGDGGTGASGGGGDGLIQFQVPVDEQATMNGTLLPDTSIWADPQNIRNPVEITPFSHAVSTWLDLGQTIHRAPGGTRPGLSFPGTDSEGFVVTLADGRIPQPELLPFRVGYLGQFDPVTGTYLDGELPRMDWLPLSSTVRVEFQAGDAVVEGSREVDLATLSDWLPDPAVATGRQFVRWRITFDIAADGSSLDESSRRPIITRFSLPLEY